VGRKHGVAKVDLIGALTDEGALNRSDIGQIDIYYKFSTVDLPAGMRRELADVFRKVQVQGQRLRLSYLEGEGKRGGKGKKGKKGKKDRHRSRPKARSATPGHAETE